MNQVYVYNGDIYEDSVSLNPNSADDGFDDTVSDI